MRKVRRQCDVGVAQLSVDDLDDELVSLLVNVIGE